MTRRDLNNEYFDWLFDLVCENRFSAQNSYRKLLMRLHSIEFRYLLLKDQARAEEGIALRYRFAITQGYEESSDIILDYLDGPCSVLEMILALAIHCEESIMDDPALGDRTGQWFWEMIVNLGLGSMTDNRYNRRRVDDVVQRFLDRDYDPDGRGGLFTIRDCTRDLRNVEIWYQFCWYLGSIM